MSRDQRKRERFAAAQDAQEQEIRRILSGLKPEHLGGATHGDNVTDDLIRWQQQEGYRPADEFDGEIYPGLKRQIYDAAKKSTLPKGEIRYGLNGEPAVRDIPTIDDWDRQDRQTRRFAKTSNRLWRSYQLQNPYDNQVDVQKAVGNLIRQSGMSLDDIVDMAEDDTSRQQLFERIHYETETVSHIGAIEGSGDDRSGGLDMGGGPARGTAEPQPEPNTETDISDQLTAWQRRMGLRDY
ncbi:hypothetical protein [Mesorhizobium sp. L-8-3]|uniref:hypothetical protein n=1 Tax=Mesorhizobium sp. L-8-3 TaxID=2744522 RepID=UPI0019289CCE|nr:hypothetical protein [Mesorhizobium sp. L-8-3]BCH25777.1 hypothetical protein MesoLjLb_55620 [Mesorhizobium sp. L-8-3]